MDNAAAGWIGVLVPRFEAHIIERLETGLRMLWTSSPPDALLIPLSAAFNPEP